MFNDRSAFLFRISGWSAIASAIIGAVAIVFLLLFFAGQFNVRQLTGLFGGRTKLLRFGYYSDILILIQFVLLLPVVAAIHRILARHAPRFAWIDTVVAIVGIALIESFQWRFVTRKMSFDDSMGYVTLGLLVTGVWMLLSGYRLQASGQFRRGILWGVLALFYFGLPLWTFVVGWRLLSGDWDAATAQTGQPTQ